VTENGRNREDQLEHNLERLLTSAAPPLGMPEPVKKRVLTALTDTGGVVTPLRDRRRRWVVAAAAAAAVALIGLWPGSPSGGISWADVVDRISEVTTLRAILDAEKPGPGGERRRFRSAIYEKDPGLYRSETLAGDGGLELVTVFRRGEEGAEVLVLFPKQERAVRTLHVIRGDGDSRLPDLGRVADAWRHLGDIASSDAYRIGERVLESRRAVGFEIPAEEFFDDRYPAVLDGVVRLWADGETAHPVRLEVDFVDLDGRRTQAELTDIEWGVELSDTLFELTAPEGWQTEETRREVVTYREVRLGRGVHLRLAPEDGPVLFTEEDVLAVRSLEAFESLTVDSPPSVVLTLALRLDAAERVEAFRSENPGSLLVVDFNAEIRVVPSFESAALIRFDLSRLGKALAGIEDGYLDTGDRDIGPARDESD